LKSEDQLVLDFYWDIWGMGVDGLVSLGVKRFQGLLTAIKNIQSTQLERKRKKVIDKGRKKLCVWAGTHHALFDRNLVFL
jgi:hypothetical protein